MTAGPSIVSSRLALAPADLLLGDFRTEGGGVIRDARLRYRIFGEVALAREQGAHLVFHALTGSADADSWWEPVIGPGRCLDTSRHPVIAANLLGGCSGSSGPGGVTDGSFPALTAADLARAHIPLIERLRVERILVATGGSLGGMVALHWGRMSPVPVERLVVFAAPARTSAQAIGWNAVQRMAIEADPAWRDGRYPSGLGPTAGLAAARAIAMITYRSQIEFEERFGRRQTRTPNRFDVEHYLRRHGQKLVSRFDARSYCALMQAMDTHDIGDCGTAGRETGGRVAEVIGVGIDTDILYYPAEVRAWVDAYRRGGANARYEEIVSRYGHDAFLIEFTQVERILRGE